MKKKRTLYECYNARVNGGRIRCDKGYPLSPKSADGSIDARRLALGERLAFGVCQNCGEFDCMGLPVPPDECGWLKKKSNREAVVR